jgi:hypothetical protein
MAERDWGTIPGEGSTVGGGLAAGETWVWYSAGTTSDMSNLTQVKYIKYITQQEAITRSDHTIKSPRCKVIAEWRDSTPRRDDEEPDICEWVVKIDPGRNWMEWSAHLTWERWCRYVSPDGDVETAFARLKSLALGQYRLQAIKPKPKSKYNQAANALMFFSESAAKAVAQEFSQAIGEARLEA